MMGEDERQRLLEAAIRKSIEERGGRVSEVKADDGRIVVEYQAEDEIHYTQPTEQEALDLTIIRLAADAERYRSDRLHKLQRIVSKLDADDELLEHTYRSVCSEDAGRDQQSRIVATRIEQWKFHGVSIKAWRPEHARDIAARTIDEIRTQPLLLALTKMPGWSVDRSDAIDTVAARFQKRLESAQKNRRTGLLFLFDALKALGCDEPKARDATRAALS